MLNKARLSALPVSIIVALLAGCGSNAGKPAGTTSPAPSDKATPAVVQNTEPVTVTSTSDGTAVDDNLIKAIQDELHKKYPYITLQFAPPAKDQTIQTMIASNSVPDLIFTHDGRIAPFQSLGLLYDLSPLVKKNNIDLNRFDKKYLDFVKKGSDDGGLYALPLDSKFHTLYYNKDIFDKNGAPYPTDGMTMDKLVELTKRVSRTDNGEDSRGLNLGSNIIWVAQVENLFTADHDKPLVNTDGWKKMFEFGKSVYSIPGNSWTTRSPKTQFIEDKTLAMLLNLNLFDDLGKAEGLNWDVAQYPSFPDHPNTYPSTSTDVLLIPNTSKHKEEALKVIEAATSDNVQMLRSKQGIVSVLNNQDIRTAFATGLSFLKGKHVQSIFKSTPASSPPISEYRQAAETIVRRSFEDFLNNKGDVYTILKQAEEQINSQTAKGK